MTPKTPQTAAYEPQRVYTPEPLVVTPNQSLTPAQGFQQPVIIMQAPTPEKSWLAAHAGQLIAGAGAAGITIALLLSVAVVAVAVGLGGICIAIAAYVLKSLMEPDNKK